MIVKILIAVLIFGITVIIHELGHFLLAKANGITVTEFSIGFGPTVVKTEKGGTVYSLKLLPFGGACQMLGEDGEEEGEGTFNSKSVWARISVVAAGPVFNMILAFFSQKWQTVRRRQRQAWKREISSLPMREDIFPSEKS